MTSQSPRKRSLLTTIFSRWPASSGTFGWRRRRPFGLSALLAAAALAAAPVDGVLQAVPAGGGMGGERADVASAPTPAAAPRTAGCMPTTTLLQFDGGYRVGMCYVTPDGTAAQAKAGVWASGQSGLLWFFDPGNAEVLVKVLDGCEYNEHRWAFVAPVTTLEFHLEVTAPDGRKWTHSNEQGATASTRSDVQAFRCADEPGASGAGAGAAAPGTPRPPSAAGEVRGAGPSLASPQAGGCVATTSVLVFDGGYKVSMCYVTPDGTVGQAKAGIWASRQSGLLWFFDRGNAEVLVKVLDGCEHNGYRWVFVAPVTTLAFELVVMAPNTEKWAYVNRQGETAAARSDVRAFSCEEGTDRAAFPLDAANWQPAGIAYADGYFYVTDLADGKVYAYDRAGKRAASRDFPLDADNAAATGIVYAGGFFHVVDSVDGKVYGYDGSGARSSQRDFSLGPGAGNGQGIAYGGGLFWVPVYDDGKVLAYDSAGVREPSRDFDLTHQQPSWAPEPVGIAYARGFLHVADGGPVHRSIYAYDGAGNRVDSRDFEIDSTNRAPVGITYADGFFYVVDVAAETVFAYPEPGN